MADRRDTQVIAPEPTGGGSPWEAIRNLKVREAELRASIDRRHLEEQAHALNARREEVEAEIERMAESEAGVAAHARRARLWGLLALGAGLLSVASAWWTVGWFLSLTWEKAALAASLFILPLIGWAVFLVMWGDRVQDWKARKIMARLGIAIAITSAIAVAALSGARMMGVTIQEEQAQAGAMATGDVAEPEDPAQADRIRSFKSILNTIAAIAVILLAVAGELAAGVAFHKYSMHATVVATARPFFKEWAALRAAVVENAAAQEETRVRGAILHAQLTTEALEQAAEAAAELNRRRAMAPKLKWVVAGLALFTEALSGGAVVVADVSLAETTVIVLDLSTSQAAAREFADNVAAVDRVIAAAAPRSRVVVLPIGAESFSDGPIFRALSPPEAGRFGEYLREWRVRAVRAWRKQAGALRPGSAGSDIVGAVSRAALEFDDAPAAVKRLILLSDMRQVGRGVNLERPTAAPEELADRLLREAPVALRGVQVSVLGAHTGGVVERHWRAIRAFWVEYFSRAGAELRAFSPNRDVARAR